MCRRSDNSSWSLVFLNRFNKGRPHSEVVPEQSELSEQWQDFCCKKLIHSLVYTVILISYNKISPSSGCKETFIRYFTRRTREKGYLFILLYVPANVSIVPDQCQLDILLHKIHLPNFQKWNLSLQSFSVGRYIICSQITANYCCTGLKVFQSNHWTFFTLTIRITKETTS